VFINVGRNVFGDVHLSNYLSALGWDHVAQTQVNGLEYCAVTKLHGLIHIVTRMFSGLVMTHSDRVKNALFRVGIRSWPVSEVTASTVASYILCNR
jgi:hypothetical protein